MAGHRQVAKLLLLHGADVQAKDEDVGIFCSMEYCTVSSWTTVAFNFGLRLSALLDALAINMASKLHSIQYMIYDLHLCICV